MCIVQANYPVYSKHTLPNSHGHISIPGFGTDCRRIIETAADDTSFRSSISFVDLLFGNHRAFSYV